MRVAVERVAEALPARGLKLVVAESCTGGLLAAALTERPGASRFLHAGLVTYSNAAKMALLGVEPRTLAAEGAVSEGVAREMVEGALSLGGDAAVAITGVAGPGGGTPEKPVGTVWVAAGLGERRAARRHGFDGDRAAVRQASASAALELLIELLEAEP